MRLLFDENLSPRLAVLLADLFPESKHVREVGLKAADDLAIWEFAKANGFAIVSKDADFRQRSFLVGAPPKVIGVLLGNASTDQVISVLRGASGVISVFLADQQAAFLELP
ncbi:MAG: DUF5615 family PIN-like protein [Phycisphaerae bacterium]|nr:DUF5615 family PIN-like protein [Phycisphaerae bacterium]MBN8599129.1 DUF5615 family PIN-like protein [Planctomycetota bacterium]